MKQQTFTAVVKQDEGWWIGWIAEVPGVNCQEASREELIDSLRSTLAEAIEFTVRKHVAPQGQVMKSCLSLYEAS